MANSSSTLPTILRTLPDAAAYTALSDHETQTPSSFFDGPPVLHFHARQARACIAREQRDKVPWGSSAEAAVSSALSSSLGDTAQHLVDVFVGSDNLSVFCPAAGSGIALPYPVIGLHAIKSVFAQDGRRVPTVYMQLELGGTTDGDDGETVEMSLVVDEAAATAEPRPAESAQTETADPPRSHSQASKLFDAISACADLHPDRQQDGDDGDDDAYPSFFGEDYQDEDDGGDGDDDGILFEDGSLEPVEGFRGVFRRGPAPPSTTADLPPPMPGSGGWITAENAHEFFDADGNWLGRDGNGPLGEGAGRVRGRDETAEAEGGADVDTAAAAEGQAGAGLTNGAQGDGTESKRQRME